jgi:hypothetical protein
LVYEQLGPLSKEIVNDEVPKAEGFSEPQVEVCGHVDVHPYCPNQSSHHLTEMVGEEVVGGGEHGGQAWIGQARDEEEVRGPCSTSLAM